VCSFICAAQLPVVCCSGKANEIQARAQQTIALTPRRLILRVVVIEIDQGEAQAGFCMEANTAGNQHKTNTEWGA
jgi:hypothetical protein